MTGYFILFLNPPMICILLPSAALLKMAFFFLKKIYGTQ